MTSFKPLLVAMPAFVLAAIAAVPVRADGETIAFFTKNQTNPFFEAERIGAAKAAARLNAKVIQYVPTQADSIPEQMSQIDDVIVKKPDAIAFVPVDYKAMTSGVVRMNAANIPVVNFTDRSSGGSFVSFIGASDYDIAKATALRLMNEIGGKGKVIIIEGVRGAVTANDRLHGFEDAVKAFPNVRIGASQPGNYQRLQGMQVTENLLQAHPDVVGIMAANDAMAIGALDAMEEAGVKAKVVGINATKEAVDAIKAGRMLASGDYNGFLQGCLAMEAAVRHLRGQPVVKEFIMKPVVVDLTNYQPYDVRPQDRDCPAWDSIVR